MNKSQALLLLLGVVLLGVLFRAFKPVPATPEATAQAATASLFPQSQNTQSAPAPAVTATKFQFEISEGERVQAPQSMQVSKGTKVVFELLTDHDDQLHLHGYDQTLELKAGTPASLSFTADRSGRFELELHHAGLELGALEVLP